MSSLRFRLISLVVTTLVVGAVSQSAGVRSAGAQSSVPASAFAHIGLYSQWPGMSRSPVLAAIRAASVRSGARSELRSLADSSFFADRDVSFGDSVFSASWADYDADGRLDVLTLDCDDMFCSHAVAKLFHNNGDGTFSEVTNTGLPGLWGSVASWADYDSDGHIDVLISGCPDDMCSTIVSKLYHNNGNGTFTENTHAGLPGVFTLLGGGVATWADYNNDGRPDVMIVGLNSADLRLTNASSVAPVVSSSAKLYRNKGDGTFSEVTNSGLPNLLSGLTNSVSWSDYDSDGYEDVLISGCSDAACSTFAGRLFHNNGNGTFTENTQAGLPGIFSPIGVNPVTWGDYDGDGRLDVLLTGSTSGGLILFGSQRNLIDPMVPVYVTKLFHNNGDGTFSEDTHAGLPQTIIAAVAWGDFNSDGRLDLLINHRPDGESFDYTATLFRNNGDGTFSEETSERHASTYIQLAWGDYNADNRPDILVSDLSWGMNSGIYKNNSTAAVTPLAAPTNLVARYTAKRFITFSWDESVSKTPTGSITYNLRVGTTPGGSEIVSPLANSSGARQVAQFGNSEGRTFAKLRIIYPGTFYWSVQAVGANFAGSSFTDGRTFFIPAKVELAVSRSQIFACKGNPRATTVTGSVNPIFDPGLPVVLQRRFGPTAGWNKVATKRSSSTGEFSFSNVGKNWKRSFWLRATINSTVAIRLVSPTLYVKVKGASSCVKPKKAKK
jgi:hypothetical protein